jgi:hypothetical protein
MVGKLKVFALYIVILVSVCYSGELSITSIEKIQKAPAKYDGKVIRVRGWLRSSRYGISLESDDFERRIRIVNADYEDVKLPPNTKEIKDSVSEKFWEYVEESTIPDAGAHGAYTELDGYVRILKKNGTPSNVFKSYGQWPIEIIPLRIRSFKLYE